MPPRSRTGALAVLALFLLPLPALASPRALAGPVLRQTGGQLSRLAATLWHAVTAIAAPLGHEMDPNGVVAGTPSGAGGTEPPATTQTSSGSQKSS